MSLELMLKPYEQFLQIDYLVESNNVRLAIWCEPPGIAIMMSNKGRWPETSMKLTWISLERINEQDSNRNGDTTIAKSLREKHV